MAQEIWRLGNRWSSTRKNAESEDARLRKLLVDRDLESVMIDPGRPWQNGTNKIFNGKFRDEWLSMEWFLNRLEARVIIEDSR